MLLTITNNGKNAEDLGYLLYKNPHRPQNFELNFGDAYVFFPELSEHRATAALLLGMNPIRLAKSKENCRAYSESCCDLIFVKRYAALFLLILMAAPACRTFNFKNTLLFYHVKL